jgi:succinoglycan biosynthesis protein ExoM
MSNGDQAGLSVVIAVLTYKRPETLDQLLSAYASMARPEDAGLKLLVIDNDQQGSAKQVVDLWRGRIEGLLYVLEGRRGIPVARNRAIDEAMALQADALCFIDDDEYPDRQWIVNLLDCWKQTGANLLGGPVEVAPPPEGATVWQKMINTSLASRQLRKNRAVERAVATNARYTIVTNNWLCDLKWLAKAGLRFDEKLLVTGGSDTAFFRAARAIRCITAWCPDAIVFETMGLERLSMVYQFRRGAYQSLTNFRIKTPRVTAKIVVSAVLIACLRAVLGVLLLIVPIFGRASPVMAVRSVGWAVGRMMAVFGRHSKLYQ